MQKKPIFALLAALCLLATLPNAYASLHADLTPLVFLLLPLAIFREGSLLALLLAALLFWRKQRFGWLLTCVVLPVCLGQLARLFLLAKGSGSLGMGISIDILPFVHATANWLLLLIAIFIKRPNSESLVSRR